MRETRQDDRLRRGERKQVRLGTRRASVRALTVSGTLGKHVLYIVLRRASYSLHVLCIRVFSIYTLHYTRLNTAAISLLTLALNALHSPSVGYHPPRCILDNGLILARTLLLATFMLPPK